MKKSVKNVKKIESKKNQNKEILKGKNFWVLIPLILICALLAGFLGQIIGQYYVSNDVLQNYQSNLDLAGLNVNPNLVIRDAKKVVVNEDVKLSETLNSVESSLIGVYKKKDLSLNKPLDEASSTKWLDSFVYYDLDKALFNSLIITSDGWMFSPYSENLMSDFEEFYKEKYIAINSSEEIYDIDEIVVDKSNDLIFFHLSDAKNLTIKKNAGRNDVFLGQSILAVKNKNTVYPGNIISLSELSDISSSEFVEYSLGINIESEKIESAFIFNLAGDLIAFSSYDGIITPSFSYNYYWRNFLEKTEISRPYLGLHYLDLSKNKIFSESLYPSKGALVWSLGDVLAVEENSPAANAGLMKGDVITWVNNIEINKDHSLAETINLFYPSDEINIVYERDFIEYKTSLILGEIKIDEIIL